MKILVVLPRIPYPIEKGDKLRAYNHVRFLSRNNTIILCALSDCAVHPHAYENLKPYCKEVHFIRLHKPGILFNMLLAFFRRKPIQVGYFYSQKAKRKINSLIHQHKPDHIFCQLIRSAEYIKRVDIPKTLDYQDVFSMGIHRRIKSAPFYLKPFFFLEYKNVLKYEKNIFDYFDNKVIISRPDRDLIPHPHKDEISIIPNGVDQEFFKPVEREKEFDLLFTGNMGYPPNINASEFLIDKIMPLVWESKPGVRVALAGANPHQRVKALASERVEVTGWVDDIREYYSRAKVFIAPMQIGTGLQNKLLEAMAMQIPSITSDLANAALRAVHEKEIMVGSTPQQYANHILRLLEDEQLARMIAIKGYEFIMRHYNWATATGKLEALMLRASNAG